MRLTKVDLLPHQTNATITCCICSVVHKMVESHADLDGLRFRDYYCPTCAQVAQHDTDVAAQDAANNL